METAIARSVRAFRKALAEQHSTFFLVYTDADLATGETRTMVTSNSTVEGISAILGLLLEPTEQAIAFVDQEMVHVNAPDMFIRETTEDLLQCREHAKALLDQLRKMFTIKGLEPISKPIISS